MQNYKAIEEASCVDNITSVSWLEVVESIGTETFPLESPWLASKETDAFAQQLGHLSLIKSLTVDMVGEVIQTIEGCSKGTKGAIPAQIQEETRASCRASDSYRLQGGRH